MATYQYSNNTRSLSASRKCRARVDQAYSGNDQNQSYGEDRSNGRQLYDSFQSQGLQSSGNVQCRGQAYDGTGQLSRGFRAAILETVNPTAPIIKRMLTSMAIMAKEPSQELLVSWMGVAEMVGRLLVNPAQKTRRTQCRGNLPTIKTGR